MKRILNFIIVIITIGYIGFLCYYNISKGQFSVSNDILVNIAVYGGCVISVVSAIVNLLGVPFGSIFLIILTVFVVVFILTLLIPDAFRDLFGMNKSFISFLHILA